VPCSVSILTRHGECDNVLMVPEGADLGDAITRVLNADGTVDADKTITYQVFHRGDQSVEEEVMVLWARDMYRKAVPATS
jgi:hypothetical protein